MTTSSKDLLDHALGSSPRNAEAGRRALVSRAYYAAYHRCREWARALPRSSAASAESRGVHQRLIDRLADPPRTWSRQKRVLSIWLSERLEVLRERRVRADYRLEQKVSEVETRAQQEEARAVFDCCNGLRKP